jgi:hypothetical protein
MDRFFTDKWLGRLDITNSILDFSSPFSLIKDEFQLFQSENLYFQFQKVIFDSRKFRYSHLF